MLTFQPQGDADMEDQSSSISQEESISPSTTPDHTLHTPPPDPHMDTDHHPGSMRNPSKWNVSIAFLPKYSKPSVARTLMAHLPWLFRIGY